MKILVKILGIVIVFALMSLLSLVWIFMLCTALVELGKGHLLLPVVYVLALIGLLSPLHDCLRILMTAWVKKP